MIKNNHDIESLQVMLIKMIEDRMLSEDDYNLIIHSPKYFGHLHLFLMIYVNG